MISGNALCPHCLSSLPLALFCAIPNFPRRPSFCFFQAEQHPVLYSFVTFWFAQPKKYGKSDSLHPPTLASKQVTLSIRLHVLPSLWKVVKLVGRHLTRHTMYKVLDSMARNNALLFDKFDRNAPAVVGLSQKWWADM